MKLDELLEKMEREKEIVPPINEWGWEIWSSAFFGLAFSLFVIWFWWKVFMPL
jgi:hypothetical protein